jgi:hypothetical protein
MSRFFETLFVVQEPTYSSQYAPGQGLMLAFGQLAFGHPWAGVLLSSGLLSALCYWMLLGWTTRGWALVGALIAVCQFGPLSMWTNYYFGGSLAGAAGSVVFGSLPRFRKHRQVRHAAFIGLGLGVSALVRPYETAFLGLSALVYLLSFERSFKTFTVVALGAAPAIGFILLHNSAVTGSWATFPYMLHQYHYGTATTFFFQKLPVPHRALTEEHEMIYKHESAIHGTEPDTLRRFAGRFVRRLNTYSFYFLPALLVPLLVSFTRLSKREVQWLVATILLFMLGTNLYPYFLTHYVAALTSVFVLFSVMGLSLLHGWKPWTAYLVLAGCFGHFLFWYGVHLTGDQRIMRNQYPWFYITWGDSGGRRAIDKRLNDAPGKHLVFVRRKPRRVTIWVHNEADIDRARIVWARDLGPSEDQMLIRYYPDRTVWLLQPDVQPPLLTPFE